MSRSKQKVSLKRPEGYHYRLSAPRRSGLGDVVAFSCASTAFANAFGPSLLFVGVRWCVC